MISNAFIKTNSGINSDHAHPSVSTYMFSVLCSLYKSFLYLNRSKNTIYPYGVKGINISATLCNHNSLGGVLPINLESLFLSGIRGRYFVGDSR